MQYPKEVSPKRKSIQYSAEMIPYYIVIAALLLGLCVTYLNKPSPTAYRQSPIVHQEN